MAQLLTTRSKYSTSAFELLKHWHKEEIRGVKLCKAEHHISSTQCACALLHCNLWSVRLYSIFLNYLINGTLARSQYSEGPATGHLDTGFSLVPWRYKEMLRWFPSFQVASACLSFSTPDINLVVTNIMFSLHVK